MYELLPPTPEESGLFSPLRGEPAERRGTIGMMKVSFGNHVRYRYPNSIWVDVQKHLKTKHFKKDIARFICYLNNNVFKGQDWKQFAVGLVDRNGWGFKAKTDEYTFYVRCLPNVSGADTMITAYDNRWLLLELAGKHELPEVCFSILPSSGELIYISHKENGYSLSDVSKPNPEENRFFADTSNKIHGITKGQEKAMFNGSIFGWDTPGAKPWNYSQDGEPLPLPPKDKNRER